MALLFTVLVGLEHIFIMIMEMFFIESNIAKNAFNIDEQFITNKKVKVMFANQGLYNGFLAAGLFWGILSIDYSIKIFFLSCVILAALFGSITANKKILLTQGMPAILALILTIFFNS